MAEESRAGVSFALESPVCIVPVAAIRHAPPELYQSTRSGPRRVLVSVPAPKLPSSWRQAPEGSRQQSNWPHMDNCKTEHSGGCHAVLGGRESGDGPGESPCS